ncbi:MAG: glycosyltransferase family 39 protein [Candidatus Dormibacteria bacterium]|jgi:4-amino-4-deoxy-L-arabinose transferase-like glycosyltransferase
MTDHAATSPGLASSGVAAADRHRRTLLAAVRRPSWTTLSVVGLLAATAALYLWSLGASGWANGFYSAAVLAATKSWKAFLFGSFDSSNFITVDKPPAALWVMDISARLFGVNAWSILVPQALEGVASVALLYATVRRHFGHAAGLIAGAVLALTPVAVLMFRYNNPDSLLVLLLVGSAYALTRALDGGRTRWLVLAGVLIGFGFLAKMMGAFLVLPGFAAVYLLGAPVSMWRRIWQLLAAGAAVLVSAGWWVTVVTLWPSADRPYIGGSTDNSELNLIFGYNGFGRLTGSETGSVGGGAGGGTSAWGPTGLLRMFNSTFGNQASWLIPAALVLGAGLLWLRWRAPRTDGKRAAALLWGSWLVVTALVFSLAQGIIHPYYTVALAPAIGALVGMGGVELWRRRDRLVARALLAIALAGTVIWAYALLARSPDWLPWLRTAVLVAGLATSLVLLVPPVRWRAAALVLAGCVLATALAGPTAYAIDTAATPHSGSIPSAGPALAGANGAPGGGGTGGPIAGLPGAGGTTSGPGGGGTGVAPSGSGPGLGGTPPQGAIFNGEGPTPPRGTIPSGTGGSATHGTPPVGAGGSGTIPGGTEGAFSLGGIRGGASSGGLLNASTPSAALTAALEKGSKDYAWIAATVGANNAAGYQLATGDPMMAIGGFNGTDPWPVLTTFEKLVGEHQIHYFIAAGSGGGLGVGGSAESSEITSWVESHFSTTTVGGTTLYDLTKPLASSAA